MDHNVTRANLATTPDLRVVRTREALRKALLSLLEEKRFEAITIREITARAGTGYATFFRHYSEPRALLNDVVADEIRDLIALALPVLRASSARATAITLCRYVDEHRQLWGALLTGESAGTMREEFIRQAKNLPRFHTKTSAWLPTDLKIVYSVSAMFEVLAWWLQQQSDFTAGRVAEILDRLIIAPMTA
jgi:AcrR family transcriptional regulator